MRKPNADQLAQLLRDLEDGVLADLPPGHPCRVEAPPSHYDQWRRRGEVAARRLERSGILAESLAPILAKIREEAAERSAQRVLVCDATVEQARCDLDEAVAALASAREDAARYAEEAGKPLAQGRPFRGQKYLLPSLSRDGVEDVSTVFTVREVDRAGGVVFEDGSTAGPAGLAKMKLLPTEQSKNSTSP